MKIVAAVLLCVIAFGAGIWLGRGGEQPASLPDGVVLYDAPRTVGEFGLVDEEGQPFDPAALKGQWSLFYFGFTHCPDICPSSLATMQRISDKADEGAAAGKLRFGMVSVDPERDTPEKLKAYVEFFSPEFIGVTGDTKAIDAFVRRFGVAAIKVDDDGMPGGYTVDHTSMFALVNADGNIVGIFPSPHKVDNIVAGIEAAVQRYSG